jgi:hypothetical protein
MRKAGWRFAGYVLIILILLVPAYYLISHRAAYAFKGSYVSNIYQDTGIPAQIIRVIDQGELSGVQKVETYILLPRRSYSRDSIIKVVKWYSSNQSNKWIYLKIFTNPDLAIKAQPLPPDRGFLLPKTGLSKFLEKMKESHDAAFALNSPFESERIGFLEYRPILWLPFYWQKIDFNRLSDLR